MTEHRSSPLDPRITPVLTRLGLIVDANGRVRRPLASALHGPPLESINPANGLALGFVDTASRDDFDAVLAAASDGSAPLARRAGAEARRRGATLAELLREHKDALGTLVALENGKIKAEGDGEVQEMIDIADFAVGPVADALRQDYALGTAAHRMYEQWHPLGVVGVVTAFNFPVAVWAWNAMLACVCGNAVRLEAVAENAALCAGGVTPRQSGHCGTRLAARLCAGGLRSTRSERRLPKTRAWRSSRSPDHLASDKPSHKQ